MITDLKDKLFQFLEEVDGVETDPYRMNWVKEVRSVDQTKANGYAFLGEWVPDGTVEIDETPRVYLACKTTGPRKHATSTYYVLVGRGDQFEFTGIETTGSAPGWALRIRDQLADLLDRVCGKDQQVANPLLQLSDEDLVRELRRRGYQVPES